MVCTILHIRYCLVVAALTQNCDACSYCYNCKTTTNLLQKIEVKSLHNRDDSIKFLLD
ncbi:hypothetical protein M758_1G266700 [Ceratodon purpureus]|uniref:Uncharacterized protein n=1 Tax=Ceratodon purpureus TaxID=3225 RepID=A0A8T0JB40_CERPU|nr:hypothetical protein KC19_1G274600 [Ceratodon purpureus]KAG0631614.1 hypothetical protein M758_1G266700 [Ceratodon purpureus]